MTPVSGAAKFLSGRAAPWAGLALLGLLFAASLSVGVAESADWQVLVASRLPRSLAALLAGAGLAIAGLVMQALARNRFVEPTLVGTGQSAAFGVLLVTLLLPDASLPVKLAGASLVALAGTGLFLALAQRLPPTDPLLVPLVGMIYGGVVGAGATFLAWRLDLLQFLEIWTSGEFSGIVRGRYEWLWLTAASVAFAFWVADRLTIASMGREASIGLGLDHAAMLRLGLLIVSVICALVVVVVGMIPFVGLVVPNLASRHLGDNLRATVPWVAGGGAALVLACDLLGRLLRYPYEIPVGTVLGIVGALMFLRLLFVRPADG
jgi:iron complex transport system permease protein